MVTYHPIIAEVDPRTRRSILIKLTSIIIVKIIGPAMWYWNQTSAPLAMCIHVMLAIVGIRPMIKIDWMISVPN